jgi:hypothetical protein
MVKNIPTIERSTKIRFGKYATDDQGENTIVFNASNAAIDTSGPGSIYMTPLRSEDIRNTDVKILTYNRTTKEVLDSNVTSDDIFSMNLEFVTNNDNVTSNTIRFINDTTSFVTTGNVGIQNTSPTHALDVGSNVYVTKDGEVRVGPSILINSSATNKIQVSGRIDTDSITLDHIGLSNTNPTITGLSLGSSTFLRHPTDSINAFSTSGNVSAAFYHGDSYFLSNLNLNNIVLQGNTTASRTVQFNYANGPALITNGNVGIQNTHGIHTLDVGSNLFVDDKGSNILVVTGNTFTSRKALIGSNVTIDTLGSNVVEVTGNTYTSRKALVGSNLVMDTMGSNVVEVTGNTFTSRKALVGSNLVMDTLGSNVVEVTGNTFTSRKALIGSNLVMDTLGSNVVEVTGNTYTSRKALVGSNVTIDTLGSNVVEVTGNTYTSRKALVGSNLIMDTLGSNVVEVTGNTYTSRKALIGSNVIIDTLGTNVVEVTGNVNVSNYTKTDYITVQKDAHIKGNLLVEGTTTTIDTTNTTFEDAVISLANNNEFATTDIGIIMKQPNSNASPTVTFRGDEKEIMIGYTLNSSLDTEITPDLANVIDLHVYGNVIAQNNITLTSGELTAITLNGNVVGNNANVITLYGNVSGDNVNAITLYGNVVGNSANVITLTGNVIGNNVDVITLNGNVSGDNVNAITLYGNVSGDNVNAITLYGNVSGDNVNAITLYGNVSGDNVNAITIYGNVVGHSANVITLYGNVISNNVYVTNNIETTSGFFKGDGGILSNVTLQQVTNAGNTTSNTVQFTNAHTAFTTDLTSNVGVKLDQLSNVIITDPNDHKSLLYIDGNWIDDYIDFTSIEVKAGEDLYKGNVVYIHDGSGDTPEVRKADSSSASTMPAIGIVMDGSINQNENGHVVTFGTFGMAFDANFQKGEILYVSNTTPGGLMNTVPFNNTDKIQNVGIVVKSGDKILVTGVGRSNDIPNAEEVYAQPTYVYVNSSGNELKKILASNLSANNQTLDMVTSWSNSTQNTIQSTHATTGFISAGNVHVGSNIFISGLTDPTNNYLTMADKNTGDLIKSPVYVTTGGKYVIDAAEAEFTGNLTFTGNATTFSSNNVVIQDRIFGLGANNTVHNLDMGILMEHKDDGEYANIALIYHADEHRFSLGYTQNTFTDDHILHYQDPDHVITFDILGNTLVQNNLTVVHGDLTAITLNGNVVGDNVSVITLNGNVVGNNVDVITLNGNVVGNNVDAITLNGNVSGDNVNAITLYGNVSGDNVSAITLNGNVSGDNVNTITLYGNVSGDNVSVITLNGNVVGDNVSAITLNGNVSGDNVNAITLYGNVSGDNVNAITLNGNVVGNTANVITLNGNVSGDNVNTITLYGNVSGDNVNTITLYGNVSGDNVNTITLYGNVSGDNVSVITLNGNVSGDNVNAITLNGNVVGDNVSAITLYGNVVADNVVATNGMYGTITGSNTISASTINAVTVNSNVVATNMYGTIAGSNTISASTIYVGSTYNLNDYDLRVEGDAEITGNLLVGGTTTTVNTENLVVKDPIIQLGDASASVDSGLLLARPSDTDNVYVGYNETESEFAIGFTDDHAGESAITVKDNVDFTLNVHGNVEASYFFGDGSQLSGIQTATPTLESVVDEGNVTSNVVQFSNVTTGIEITSNIDFVNKITLKSTSVTKSNLFVVNAIQLDPTYDSEVKNNVLSYNTTTGEIYDSGGQGGSGSSFNNITEENANVLIGSNLTINSLGSNVLTVSGNVSADNITIGGLNVAASPFALDDVVSVYEGANVTANVLTLGGVVTNVVTANTITLANNLTVSGNIESKNIRLNDPSITTTFASGMLTIDAANKTYGTGSLITLTENMTALSYSNLIEGSQLIIPITSSGGNYTVSNTFSNVDYHVYSDVATISAGNQGLMTVSNLNGNVYMNMLPFQDVTTGFGGGGGGGTSGYVSGDLTVTGGLTVTDLDVDASVTGNVITLNGGNRTFGVSPLLEVNSSKVEHLVYTNLRHGSELKVLMNAFTQFTLSEISNVNRYHYSGVTTVEAGDIALMTFSNLHGSIYADLKISYGVSTFVVRATGGSVTTYTDAGTTYKVHTFTSSGDFTVTSGGEVEYLIIAGGGGGGSDSSTGGRYGGGGGGAGGYRCSVAGELSGGNSSPESLLNLTNGIYTVTVGAGGAGGNYTSAPGERGTNGNDSSLSTIVSFGGGGGSGSYTGGDSGGSGGGGAEGGGPGSGTANQGFSGGVRGANDGNGGGGGAGGAGGTSSTDDVGGSGGVGISSNINGTLVGRAGGGGGSTNGSASDGGGSGANGSGTINTGGGGGASENNNSSGGGSGGSGIVIIRYAI